jgi:sugar/nucleoside kinase (ribokinase family)
MLEIKPLSSIDYLVIGHITCDLTSQGPRLGGTAAYAALTARRLGLRVGVLTSRGDEIPLGPLRDLPIVNLPSERSTTFENILSPAGRRQIVHHTADSLGYYYIPDAWRSASIIHLGPVAQEIDPGIVRMATNSLLCVTPQGWLRDWDGGGRVYHTEWPEAGFVLGRCGAAVISLEDVDEDEDRIEEMAFSCPVLAVTEAHQGARVFWNGDSRRFRAPQVEEIDPTGSGDIFAAAFFTRLYTTRDPWEAGRFATQLASFSVARRGLESVPTAQEIEACMVEVR